MINQGVWNNWLLGRTYVSTRWLMMHAVSRQVYPFMFWQGVRLYYRLLHSKSAAIFSVAGNKLHLIV